MQQIQVQPVPLDMLKAILAPAQWSRLVTTAARARALLAGRVVWNVNATAHGGGVAEMLQSLLAYARGAGVDARWLVLDGDPEFFAITKRVHNALHGSLNGGQGLGASEHEHYEQVLEGNLVDLAAQVRPGDIVLLHDPQTAGLVEGLHQTGRAGDLAQSHRPRRLHRRHGLRVGVPARLPHERGRLRVLATDAMSPTGWRRSGCG